MIFHVDILTHCIALHFTNYELGCFKSVGQTGVGHGQPGFSYLQKMGSSVDHHVRAGSGAHSTSQTLCSGAVFPEIQKAETETNQSPRPSAEIEYVDLCLPSPLYFHDMVFK